MRNRTSNSLLRLLCSLMLTFTSLTACPEGGAGGE